MEHTTARPIWRLWVNNQQRIVSFHAVEGFEMLEFQSHEMFMSCVDSYVCQWYRYQ